MANTSDIRNGLCIRHNDKLYQIIEFQHVVRRIPVADNVLEYAVQLATNSYYSHCGIIIHLQGKAYVFEAIEPVGVRPIESWIESGKEQKYAVYRLENLTLSAEQLLTMRAYLEAQIDKHYDLGFNWSDKEMYCSELVYKAYKSVGIELCHTKALRDFNLESPQVRRIMQQRYGTQIPYDEPMVSPGQLSESKFLHQIY